jgi:hypothetical protein
MAGFLGMALAEFSGAAVADFSGLVLVSSVMWVLLARQIKADSDFIVRGGRGIICKVDWGIVCSHPCDKKTSLGARKDCALCRIAKSYKVL